MPSDASRNPRACQPTRGPPSLGNKATARKRTRACVRACVYAVDQQHACAAMRMRSSIGQRGRPIVATLDSAESRMARVMHVRSPAAYVDKRFLPPALACDRLTRRTWRRAGLHSGKVAPPSTVQCCCVVEADTSAPPLRTRATQVLVRPKSKRDSRLCAHLWNAATSRCPRLAHCACASPNHVWPTRRCAAASAPLCECGRPRGELSMFSDPAGVCSSAHTYCKHAPSKSACATRVI
jgi:hypothetical protein